MATDFVGIIGDFANFVQQERNAAYEEAEKQWLRYIKDWIREQHIDPSTADNVPDILDDFINQWASSRRMEKDPAAPHNLVPDKNSSSGFRVA
jgi:hypothetical protein